MTPHLVPPPALDRLETQIADLSRVMRDPVEVAKAIVRELELPSDPDDDESASPPTDLGDVSAAGYSRLAAEYRNLRAQLRDPLAMSRHLSGLLSSATNEGAHS